MVKSVLVDASGLIYQGFHASKRQEDQFRLRSDGFPVAALRDFTRRIWNFVFDGIRGIQLDRVGIVFDYDGRTIRHDLYSGYKGGRDERPEELKQQLPLMRDVVRAFGLIPIELAGYEADDLIASYAKLLHENNGDEVVIVTYDKDFCQLVRPGVTLYSPAVGDPRFAGYRPEKWMSRDEVIEKFGVPPSQVVDVQSLMGDAADKVPGVPKIGEKLAAELIRDFGSVENVIAFAHTIRKPATRKAIEAHIDDIRLSRQLVSLFDDLDVPVPIEALALKPPEPEPLLAFFTQMELVSWRRRTLEHFGLVEAVEHA